MSNGCSVLSRTPLLRALLLALALAAPGCQPPQPRTAPEAAPQQASAAAEAPANPAAPTQSAKADTAEPGAQPALEPPDGKWLVDEEGREYYIYTLPRIENTYLWVEEGKSIRVRYGLVLDLADYDEKTFYVKYYRPPAQVASSRPQVTDEERERVAASYRTEVASRDRLRFAPISQGLPSEGQWRQGFDVADLNGDGRLDLVHGPARKAGGDPAVFLGDGKGSWRRWSGMKMPNVPFDYGDAAVADLNGDGKSDLVLASHLRGLTAMLGDGKGGFTLWSQGIDFRSPDESREAPVFTSRAVEIVDWNGDGRPDILAVGEGPTFGSSRQVGTTPDSNSRGSVIYLNNGDGTWTRKEGSGPFSDALAVADFNADGRPDFVTGSSQLGVKSLLNLSREDGSWETVAIAELRPRAIFRSVAAADFNRDGRTDLAVGYSSFELGVWRSGIDVLLAEGGSGWQRRALAAEESQSGIWSLAAGDLDADGATDVLGLDGEGRAWVFLGDGKGSFVREESAEVGPADGRCRGYHARLADVDGDGADEILAAFAGESQGLPLAGLPPVAPPCPSGGSLRAWKAVRSGDSTSEALPSQHRGVQEPAEGKKVGAETPKL
jgi:hypothetical protein